MPSSYTCIFCRSNIFDLSRRLNFVPTILIEHLLGVVYFEKFHLKVPDSYEESWLPPDLMLSPDHVQTTAPLFPFSSRDVVRPPAKFFEFYIEPPTKLCVQPLYSSNLYWKSTFLCSGDQVLLGYLLALISTRCFMLLPLLPGLHRV
jgi:hypothetical protein